jgi:hypothetical protein
MAENRVANGWQGDGGQSCLTSVSSVKPVFLVSSKKITIKKNSL